MLEMVSFINVNSLLLMSLLSCGVIRYSNHLIQWLQMLVFNILFSAEITSPVLMLIAMDFIA